MALFHRVLLRPLHDVLPIVAPSIGPFWDPILDPLWHGTIYACTPYHTYIGLKPSTGCSAGTHYGT